MGNRGDMLGCGALVRARSRDHGTSDTSMNEERRQKMKKIRPQDRQHAASRRSCHLPHSPA